MKPVPKIRGTAALVWSNRGLQNLAEAVRPRVVPHAWTCTACMAVTTASGGYDRFYVCSLVFASLLLCALQVCKASASRPPAGKAPAIAARHFNKNNH